MARRPIESALYRELVESRFQFIERGTREIKEIYELVKQEFPRLCDDDYRCPHQRNIILPQSEWKHVVRSALSRCKKIYDLVEYSGRRGFWTFL